MAIPDNSQILTASKNIKLWDVDAKEVLQTFTGHSSDVIFLKYINPRKSEDAYFISGSKVKSNTIYHITLTFYIKSVKYIIL